MSSVSIEERIERGRKAVALASEKGLDTTSWVEELHRLEQVLQQAQEVAQRTRQLLDTQGWCLWHCEALGGEVIVVVNDDQVTGVPRGYPVYTDQELIHLFGGQSLVGRSRLRLIHQAKKLAPATVICSNHALP